MRLWWSRADATARCCERRLRRAAAGGPPPQRTGMLSWRDQMICGRSRQQRVLKLVQVWAVPRVENLLSGCCFMKKRGTTMWTSDLFQWSLYSEMIWQFDVEIYSPWWDVSLSFPVLSGPDATKNILLFFFSIFLLFTRIHAARDFPCVSCILY